MHRRQWKSPLRIILMGERERDGSLERSLINMRVWVGADSEAEGVGRPVPSCCRSGQGGAKFTQVRWGALGAARSPWVCKLKQQHQGEKIFVDFREWKKKPTGWDIYAGMQGLIRQSSEWTSMAMSCTGVLILPHHSLGKLTTGSHIQVMPQQRTQQFLHSKNQYPFVSSYSWRVSEELLLFCLQCRFCCFEKGVCMLTCIFFYYCKSRRWTNTCK